MIQLRWNDFRVVQRVTYRIPNMAILYTTAVIYNTSMLLHRRVEVIGGGGVPR